ncbi:ABC transporter ATP-binding protein [Methanocella conradii]|uniref:ABC transporter ATP-binding protein n=1 Tax=Methanocella conradii TaxID=1175444 RepID=UPI0024B355C3|nr:ABC transporter ATP-binding protein [Methanocella conradii]MDI6896847.1 ABC transporter ATP-binding protein [Methanocella conradii]
MKLLLREKTAGSGQDAIAVKGLSKRFKIPRQKKRTLYENVVGLFHGNYGYETLWALRDLSFSVKHGETLGVIGPNGSGKSTLLKLLAGVLCPDSGRVDINGRIAPFLELGVGFHPDLTGRDNVYLYSAILGMTRKEIKKKYDEVWEFAELKRFEDVKLRSFSSGMHVRLAFSIAIQANPDILLLDEVFAVGDEHFQKKCAEKVDEIRRSGKTIVFVSHDMGSVRRICDKAMLLNGGRLASIGETAKVIDDYLRISRGPIGLGNGGI